MKRCIMGYMKFPPFLHPADKNEMRLTDIDFPVKLKDITKFESQNPSISGVNVFSINDNNNFYPLRVNQKDCQQSIDLLYEQDGVSHYSLIKHFSRLFSEQMAQ